jgi:hypothetical protein
VRRESDNHEQDFTASEVSSGALVDFVNAQVTAPLDIQALTSTGRDGDFLIAKAAYSLRSLGTRQATVAATGDTVARANGKYVCQVRRSSDDALKSFTADEITDGTLLSFVGTSGSDNGFVKTWYDQSVTTQAGDTATGNHVTQATASKQPKIVSSGSLLNELVFDGSDDFLQTTANFDAFGSNSLAFFTVINPSDLSGNPRFLNTRSASPGIEFILTATPRLYYKDSGGNGTNGASQSASLSAGTEVLYTNLVDRDTDQTVDAFKNGSSVTTSSPPDLTGVGSVNSAELTIGANNSGGNLYNGKTKEIIIYASNQEANRTAIEANIGEHYSISGIPAFDNSVNGFVETWYDQFGNKDATQPTASKQPKIVSAGTLLNELDFDGSDDELDFTVLNASDVSIFSVASFDDTAGQDRIISGQGSQSGEGFGKASATRGFFRASGQSAKQPVLNATISADQDTLLSFIRASDTGTFFTNGTASDTFTESAAFQAGSIGGAGSKIDGSLKELIIYNSDQTSSRTAIETNINSQYLIF